jgi:type I restriction enzyme S subunit
VTVGPYPAYKDSKVEWLGPVPADWAVRRIKDSVQAAKNGVWGEEPDSGVDDFRCVRVADFDRPRLSVASADRTFRKVRSSDRVGRQLERGDLLLEKSGGGEKSPVGFVVLFDLDDKAVCSNFVSRVKLARGMVPKYWTYLHATTYALRLTQRSIKQTSGIQNLDQASYFNELAPFPSEAEQRQIAEYLDARTAKIDVLIEKQEQLIETLAERRQAVISHAVTKGLDSNAPMKNSGSVWFPTIPEHWSLVPCGSASALVQTGPFGSQLHSDEYVWGGTPVINPSHIVDGEITPDGSVSVDAERSQDLARHHLREGDIVAARRGEMGRCAVVRAEAAGYLCGTGSLIIRMKSDAYVPEYFQLIFSSSDNRATLTERSIGATMDNLNADIVARLRLPKPPFAEQREIIEFLDRETAQVDALAAKAREMIDVLKERRQALISAAVTGKIDVRGLF